MTHRMHWEELSARAVDGDRVMRGINERRCGLVDVATPCRCSRQVRPSIEHRILHLDGLISAPHPGVDGPIGTGTVERAATHIDVVEVMAEIHRSDPPFQVPTQVWVGVRQAAPDPLG